MAGIGPTGIDLDPYKSAYTGNITATHGGSLTANTWYDVPGMATKDDLPGGIYILQIYASNYNGGASLYQSQANSEPLTWFTYTQNDTSRSTIRMASNWMGHAVNFSEDPNDYIEFAIKKRSGGDGANGGLQFMPKFNLSLDAANGGKILDIHIYRLL